MKRTTLFLQLLMTLPGIFCSYKASAWHETSPKPHAVLVKRMEDKYPQQFTNPEKKERKTFSQFGYNLYEFTVPVFPITKFINPDKFGHQSYGRPNRRLEKNGALYTCRGGFIDFSHMRAALDWTVFLTFMILKDNKQAELPWEAGKLQLSFQNTDELNLDDIASMAQKIAFERLVWHEVASWHYHKPYHKIGEQQSTFTPEDTYSNMLGAAIGKKVALRMLADTDNASYSQIATEEIDKYIASLDPMYNKAESKWAYDMVDLNRQRKLPENIRNKDVWYDSRIVFHDQRYVFKRYMNIGPDINPWLVPKSEQLGCEESETPEVIKVPQVAHTGSPFYDYYSFSITPDSNMFYDHKRNRQLHPPFGPFTTAHYDKIMAQIDREMGAVLRDDFDKRDDSDPTVYFTHVHKVMLK